MTKLTDAESAFDREFRVHGGRLDTATVSDSPELQRLYRTDFWGVQPSLCPPPVRSVFEYYRYQARKKIEKMRQHARIRNNIPTTHFDYINNTGLNAAAATTGTYDFVGLFPETIPILHALFARILCSPRCLTWVGNPTEESKKQLRKVEGSLYTSLSLWQGESRIGPEDRVRNFCSIMLTWDAFDFIILHELGHIWNGHCDLQEKDQGTATIMEISRPGSETDNMLRQCLEMDADAFAITLLTRNALWRGRHKHTDDYMAALFSNPERALFYQMFAMYSVWRLFVPETNLTKPLASYTHFPPAMRQVSNAANIHAVLEHDRERYLADKLPDMWSEVVREVELGFSEITGRPFDLSTQAYAVNEEGLVHTSRVRSLWKTLFPKLGPLARYDGLTPGPS